MKTKTAFLTLAVLLLSIAPIAEAQHRRSATPTPPTTTRGATAPASTPWPQSGLTGPIFDRVNTYEITATTLGAPDIDETVWTDTAMRQLFDIAGDTIAVRVWRLRGSDDGIGHLCATQTIDVPVRPHAIVGPITIDASKFVAGDLVMFEHRWFYKVDVVTKTGTNVTDHVTLTANAGTLLTHSGHDEYTYDCN